MQSMLATHARAENGHPGCSDHLLMAGRNAEAYTYVGIRSPRVSGAVLIKAECLRPHLYMTLDRLSACVKGGDRTSLSAVSV
jgi:hypothetical protein